MADVIAEARVVADLLTSIARAFRSGEARAADRPLAEAATESASKLAHRLRSYAEALAKLRHRRIEGFAIGYLDPAGKRWFIHHAWSWGNLMRTPDVESACLWPDLQAAKVWARAIRLSKGGDGKGPWPAPARQLDGLTMQVWPVGIAIGEEALTFETEATLA